MNSFSTKWTSELALDYQRQVTSGSEENLAAAISNGADLRIYTEFRHNEHLDTSSTNNELVQEVSEFGITYLIGNRWVAGIMSLRQPIVPPVGFGPRPSMSFFLYNQNGQQAIARPYLDGPPVGGTKGESDPDGHPDMPKYHQLDNWDADTNAPSQNFIYEFETYRFCVRNDWQEVLSHDANGNVVSGSLNDLVAAFEQGCEVKAGIAGLNKDLSGDSPEVPHELFVQLGPCYYHTESKVFSAGSHPVVRVAPAIPLVYQNENWNCSWLMLRNDGLVSRTDLDPYTLKFHRAESQHAIRWFVR